MTILPLRLLCLLRHSLLTAAAMGLALSAAAGALPAELPAVDGKPPTTDKPVKVYILSGQSNCLGFGRVSGASPIYQRVFLSADPTAKNCTMPVKGAAMMKMGVYQSAAKDAKSGAIAKLEDGEQAFELGSTLAKVPDGKGKPVIAEALLEMPLGGVFEIHLDPASSANCVATVEGKEVYRKEGESIKITGVELKKGKRYPISITYWGGGSAALWAEKMDLEGMGDLEWVIAELGKFKSLKSKDGEWTERPDVLLCDAYMGKGKSAPLSAKAVGPTFGPELGFGWVMGEFHDEPVIVMKADIGNRSLGWDILPPGTESWEHEGKTYPGYGLTLNDDGKPVKPKEGGWYAGKQYDDYTASIHAVLDNFKQKYPEYAGQGFEVAGFLWWQGHKDGPNPGHNARYEQNLVNLIKAWRKEFKAPEADWVIATVAFDGSEMPDHYVKIAQAQKNVADPKRHPDLAGTVKTIDAVPFWRPAGMSPKNQNYHYNHNAETYMLVGDALGRAMVELKGGKVEYPSGAIDESINFIPQLGWVRGAEVEALVPALKPIMIDGMIPAYVAKADEVPVYLRRGMPLSVMLANKRPEKTRKDSIVSQLDKMIEFYELAGIDDYSWKPVNPAALEAEWQYASIDPGNEAGIKNHVRYREPELPKGWGNWQAPDFDAAKAGWKTGKAPFGQKGGEAQPLITSCRASHCRCDMVPNTLWENELLLMRRTIPMPDFDPGKRYRLIVGGAGHGWSGEGFALYIEGELVSEMKSGYYKSGGDPRGVILFEDLQQKYAGKEVTVAVMGFLRMSGHKGKPAPAVGHLNAWLESAQLAPAALEALASLPEEEPKK